MSSATILTCLFDKCELLNGLFLGVISSLIASGLVLLIIFFKNKKKYGKAVGEYLGFGYSEVESDLILNEKHQSKVTIKYLKKNQLKIELTDLASHPNNKWTGTVFMELENYGSIAWKYDIYEGEVTGGNKHKFGFKRLIINDTSEGRYIYLISENIGSGEKYKNEVLKSVMNSTRT